MEQIRFRSNTQQQNYSVTVCSFERDASFRNLIFSDLNRLLTNKRAFIITDPQVAELHLNLLSCTLSSFDINSIPIVLPCGERAKSIDCYTDICSALLEYGCNRNDVIINLGGGVVEDAGGFAAATYMRGIRYINMPTSLLSMVDSSLGGKTGIDFHGTKNVLGVFHQPTAVYINMDFLKTLPEREFRSGMGEIIKYAVIVGLELIKDVASPKDVNEITIGRCCQIKCDYVCDDILDNRKRRILNLGHSFGHAFEAASNLRLSHGEAIGLGLIAAAEFGETLGITSNGIVNELKQILLRFDMPTEHSEYDNAALKFIEHDKKAYGKMIDMVFIKEFGQPLRRSIPIESVKEFLAHE